MNRKPNKYVDLTCMVACYLLVACIALMAARPDLVYRIFWGI